MPRRIETDDEVRRFNAVYLGPVGWTLPFHARYSAYAVGALIFVSLCLVEAILPGVSVGTPPIWEAALTILGTSIVMTAVDHDKPVAAVVRNVRDARAAARQHRTPVHRTQPRAAGIKTTKDPIQP